MSDKSDFIVYVDESGDHGLANIDKYYPVFVLAFCIFKKEDYSKIAAPKLQEFKFKHFGHDMAVLHEQEIRKDKGDFSFLKTKELKINFINELTDVIDQIPFTVIATVIKKGNLKKQYTIPENPYHIALGFGLERVYRYLEEKNQNSKTTHVVLENRGKKEDNELELEFRRVCDGNNYFKKQLPFQIVFADKKSNSTGLQISDLLARPIGLSIIKPNQINRAFEVIQKKLYRNEAGNFAGFGLKVFP